MKVHKTSKRADAAMSCMFLLSPMYFIKSRVKEKISQVYNFIYKLRCRMTIGFNQFYKSIIRILFILENVCV